LKAQTFKDFELLAYHDGPLLDSSTPMPVDFRCTPQCNNDWGHSLRDLGIREARGDYLLFFNSDNILYPNCLEELSKAIDRPPRILEPKTGRVLDTNNILIFALMMRGMVRFGEQVLTIPDHPEYTLILTGNPPRWLNIDAMQLVMRRDLWLAEGGWYDKTQASDGKMYPQFATKYGYRSVDLILGEHW
jgi:hypothetical protein